jgi:hypothetical protein
LLWAVACTLLLAATTWAQHVTSDYDPHADFSRYHTYLWLKISTPDTIWDHRVQDAVDQQLTAKGLTKLPSGGDLAVTAIGIARNKTEMQTYYDNLGGWRWNGFGTATSVPKTYRVGTLVVDLFNGGTKQLAWRATARDTLSDKPAKNEKKLSKAVAKMFKNFPPDEKK